MAADVGESVEDMLTKLDTYREQLALVEGALKEKEDDHLIKLREDLQEVIMYTEDLVRYKNAAATAAMTEDKTQKKQKSAHAALVDRTCEVFYENKWYNAKMMSVRRDEKGVERCSVKLIGIQLSREYKISEVRLLKPPPPVQCQVGAEVQAIFSEDGLWYDATIVEQTETGYKVEFKEYGEKEDLRFDMVRLKQVEKKAKNELLEAKQKNIKIVETPGGWKLPETLIVQPTDTDKQRELKRRKIHQLKSEQRKEREDIQMAQRQNSWMKFKNKASTKSKTGFMTGKQKESIFRVPDAIEGRVGVMNSGQGMTTFVDKQKFTYSEGGR